VQQRLYACFPISLLSAFAIMAAPPVRLIENHISTFRKLQYSLYPSAHIELTIFKRSLSRDFEKQRHFVGTKFAAFTVLLRLVSPSLVLSVSYQQ
jgi:hypothetical protein